MYQLTNSTQILRLSDNANIPADPANTDYAQYLQWLSEGNTPLPYVEPPIGTPTAVTMVQARLALLSIGLLDDVEAGISSMSKASQIEWEFRPTVERPSELVQSLAVALGLDSAALDDLFTAASKL